MCHLSAADCYLSSQTRKLQEMFKALQQENEELKRHLGMRGNAAGGACGGRSGLAAPRSGANTTRQVSPFRTGATQMVRRGNCQHSHLHCMA